MPVGENSPNLVTLHIYTCVGSKWYYQGCQIFLGSNIPNWENKTNDHKLYQMDIK
jgi:hypothetical protein